MKREEEPCELTDNQKAILQAVKSGEYRLVGTTGGWALWRKDIEWSQGRTPANAISKEDEDALSEKWVAILQWGDLALTFKSWRLNTKDAPSFVPCSDAYRGEPLMR